MASGEDIPRWDANHAEFCARIEKVRATVKILLKTKNDPIFIERWIKHHIKIVGPENLIIFDNMSDDPEVLSIYRKYRDQIIIITFAGFHNRLHHIPSYYGLYQSLAKSSDYFLFLDTDEYLILIENDTLLHLLHLFPRQRILNNVNKLIGRGMVQPGESPKSIALRNDITDETAALYVKEIRDFLPLEGRQMLSNTALSDGCLELSPDGAVSYYGDVERKMVSEFIVDPKPVYDLIADRFRLKSPASA